MKGVLLLIKLPDILIIKKCLEYVSKQGRTFSMSSVDLSACNIFSSCLMTISTGADEGQKGSFWPKVAMHLHSHIICS